GLAAWKARPASRAPRKWLPSLPPRNAHCREQSMLLPDAAGHFGEYGGRFVPETLIPALEELETAWRSSREGPAFQSELSELLRRFSGRAPPISQARRMSAPFRAPRL